MKHIAQHMYALEQLTAARPLILSLGLKNYEREDVMAVVEFVASAVRGDGTAGEGATVPQQPSNTAAAVASA